MQFRHIFFLIFSKLSGIWRGINALRRCPAQQGAGHDIADFGVIWGPLFFDQKSTFFNFDFNKTWFGGGLDPLVVEKKMRTFFPRGAVMGLAKNNLAEFGGRKGPNPQKNTKILTDGT